MSLFLEYKLFLVHFRIYLMQETLSSTQQIKSHNAILLLYFKAQNTISQFNKEHTNVLKKKIFEKKTRSDKSHGNTWWHVASFLLWSTFVSTTHLQLIFCVFDDVTAILGRIIGKHRDTATPTPFRIVDIFLDPYVAVFTPRVSERVFHYPKLGSVTRFWPIPDHCHCVVQICFTWSLKHSLQMNKSIRWVWSLSKIRAG